MKPARAFFLVLFAGLTFIAATAQAQYRAGDIVSTNFGFVSRYRWTNDNGQVFGPGATFRLSDFDGKIVFFIFFDVW